MRFLFLIVWLVQIIMLLFFYFIEDLNYSDSNLALLILMGGVNTLLFFIYKKKIRQSKKSGIWSLIFLVGYIIVFFQFYIDLLFGNFYIYDRIFANSNTIINCVIISLCGLFAFFCGYTFRTIKSISGHKEVKPVILPKTTPLKILLFISLLLFIIYNYKIILMGGYSQEMLEAQAGTMGLYSNMLFQIFLFLYVSYKSSTFKYFSNTNFKSYVKHIGFIVNVCVVIYAIGILMSGDRGPVIVLSLAYWGGYLLATKNDISYVRLTLFIGVAAVLITLLGNMRKLDNNMAYWDKIKQSVNTIPASNESFSPYTKELAGSVSTLHYAVDYVPNKHPFLYGSFQFRQLCSTIPFMNHLVYTFTDRHFKYRSSAYFVTWIIQGENYTYGSGTSCNADLYLSFGIIGVVFGLLLWGVIYRRIEDHVDSSSINIIGNIVILYFLSYSLYVNRASVFCFINFMMFTIIFKFIYEKLFIKREIIRQNSLEL